MRVLTAPLPLGTSLWVSGTYLALPHAKRASVLEDRLSNVTRDSQTPQQPPEPPRQRRRLQYTATPPERFTGLSWFSTRTAAALNRGHYPELQHYAHTNHTNPRLPLLSSVRPGRPRRPYEKLPAHTFKNLNYTTLAPKAFPTPPPIQQLGPNLCCRTPLLPHDRPLDDSRASVQPVQRQTSARTFSLSSLRFHSDRYSHSVEPVATQLSIKKALFRLYPCTHTCNDRFCDVLSSASSPEAG